MFVRNSKTSINCLNKISKKYFQLMTPEEYLSNMNESARRIGVESCKLQPLPAASINLFNLKTTIQGIQDAGYFQFLTKK
jgi:hypothetical protein